MKAGREHRVPLSRPGLAILDTFARLRPRRASSRAPGAAKPLSRGATRRCSRRLGVDATTHGFRSAFRDWAAETTTFPHEVCEAALAHVIADKTEAAYRRGDLFDNAGELMDAWAAYCDPGTDNVVTLRA